MRSRLRDSVSDRYRADENSLLTKHVVAAGRFAKDPGSTPGASTILRLERASVSSKGWTPDLLNVKLLSTIFLFVPELTRFVGLYIVRTCFFLSLGARNESWGIRPEVGGRG